MIGLIMVHLGREKCTSLFAVRHSTSLVSAHVYKFQSHIITIQPETSSTDTFPLDLPSIPFLSDFFSPIIASSFAVL